MHGCLRLWCARIIPLVITSLLALPLCQAETASIEGTTTFLLDGNRMYAELGFLRSDGSLHQALAFVDMGSPGMALRESLYEELQIDLHRPLTFKVGDLVIEVPDSDVTKERGAPSSLRSQLKVEGTLAAAILQKYRVEIDYQRRTLTLSQHQTSIPEGVAVLFQINKTTGLIAVPASIDDKAYWMTVDNGSAYTWIRQSTARIWLGSHPDWERGTGAVGPSNMMMSGDSTETEGTLLRVPEMSLGTLLLESVGALAVGSGHLFPGNVDLFDWYSQKNAVPVIGWIGGNVLQAFHLTIDYPNRTSYWLRQKDAESRELDQVGLTLRYTNRSFVVAAIATKHGKPTVEGVLPGDKLIKVDKLETDTATWGAIYGALHGKPGETRSLILERNGRRLAIHAKVTGF